MRGLWMVSEPEAMVMVEYLTWILNEMYVFYPSIYVLVLSNIPMLPLRLCSGIRYSSDVFRSNNPTIGGFIV